MDEKNKTLYLLTKHEFFNENVQKKVGRDRSTVYAVYLLESNKIEPTFQRICIVCFKLFPESFSFPEFSEFPDSRIVRNCLWHCVYKTKGWLVGSDKTKYSITEKSRIEVIPIFLKLLDSKMNVEESLPHSMKVRGKELVTKSIDKEGKIIQEIKQSKGFQLFNGKREEIKSFDIKQSLGGDRYVSEAFLNKKLKEAVEACMLLNDNNVISYLKWIEENWNKYIR
jgi:hypothetical protein